MKKNIKILMNVVISILIIFNLILGATIITTRFNKFYYMNVELLKIEENSGFSLEKIKENYDYTIRFILNQEGDKFKLPSMEASEEGAFHFDEVRLLFNLAKICLIIGVILLGTLIYIYNKTYREYSYVKHSALALIILPIILVGVVSTNFNYFFTLFHKLTFNNDKWLFDPSIDPIINILPEQYFANCGVLIIFICFLIGIITYVIYRLKLKKSYIYK